MSQRDEQFAGFARAAFDMMLKAAESHVYGDELDLGSEEAQHAMLHALRLAAHDLVEHTHSSILDLVGSWSDPISIMCEDDFVARIPDLPVLPEEKSE